MNIRDKSKGPVNQINWIRAFRVSSKKHETCLMKKIEKPLNLRLAPNLAHMLGAYPIFSPILTPPPPILIRTSAPEPWGMSE